MSKVLFISNGESAANEIASALAVKHRIKKCAPGFEDFLMAVDEERPEAVVVVMDKKFFETLISMFMLECPDTPIIVVGSQKQGDTLKQSGCIPTEWVKFILEPAKASDIMQRADELLKKKGAAPKNDEPIQYKRFTGRGKPQVLLVDDDPTIVRAMQKTLSQKFDVSFATSGRQALSYLQKNNADIILLDYEMPEMNGLQTLKNLRADENTRMIPVIFLTGLADFEHVFDAVEMRPQGYLLKPCAENRLFTEIEKVLGIKK